MMMLSKVIFQHRLAFQFLHHNPCDYNNHPNNAHAAIAIRKNSNSSWQQLSLPKFLPHASSISSPGAGAAEYSDSPGQLLDAKPKQDRRNRIAGIDQDQLLDPALLADSDSCFHQFKGIQIHYKLYDAMGQPLASSQAQAQAVDSSSTTQSKKLGLPFILLHGFGASAFSWNRVLKPLAELTASKVLAFDRPAFGLTSRVEPLTHSSHATDDTRPLNPYSMAFSVLATLYFIGFLAADKAILVGHSAGSLVAVNSYFEAPERVAALILVAPAIFAPLAAPKLITENKSASDHRTDEGERSNSNMLQKPLIKLFEILSKFTANIVQAILQIVKGMTDMLSSLYKKALTTVLRSAFGVMLIRMIIDKFGIAAVKTAWHDPNKVNEHVISGYTKPLRARGWDKALAEFTAATLATNESETKPPLSKRLQEISCPVLIVTGDDDRIVPSWNAKRLSQAVPGCCLEVVKNCGHLPHEEKAEEFVFIIEKFLQKAFGDSKELSAVQAAV